ncbi:DUF6011 domain-containing protein [Streptomyces sp. NPDC006274]|uniref:DUF6011 domain-containing protein n=1 Tax=unclassified Streptomyces TaxID=2593676 RepID=UPI0033A59E6A
MDRGAPLMPLTCQDCGRPLHDPESRAAGRGPVCAAKYHGSRGAAGQDQLIFDETTEDPMDNTQGGRPTPAPHFRKRPVEIDARQFNIDTAYDVLAWIREQGGKATEAADDGGPVLLIETLEGVMRGNVGDWIIRGVQGEFYPCKPDIFADTYAPADDAPEGPSDTAAELAKLRETLHKLRFMLDRGKGRPPVAAEYWRDVLDRLTDDPGEPCDRDQLAAAIDRASERCQQVRDREGPGGMINASQILGLLSPTWPDGNFEAPTPAPEGEAGR